jgi:hypothetical protein
MSRRISFVALAASATLIATHAVADRECFEDSCRMQEAVEAQAAAAPPPSAPEPAAAAANADASAGEAKAEAKVETRREPAIVAAPQPAEPLQAPAAATKLQSYPPPPAVVRAEPDTVLPRVTSEPALRRVPPQISQPQNSPRYEDARARREPPVRIPQHAERPQPPAMMPSRPVRSVPPAAAYVESAPIASPPPAPARPYGTYRNYPTAPGYVLAPNARIISIEPNN